MRMSGFQGSGCGYQKADCGGVSSPPGCNPTFVQWGAATPPQSKGRSCSNQGQTLGQLCPPGEVTLRSNWGTTEISGSALPEIGEEEPFWCGFAQSVPGSGLGLKMLPAEATLSRTCGRC